MLLLLLLLPLMIFDSAGQNQFFMGPASSDFGKSANEFIIPPLSRDESRPSDPNSPNRPGGLAGEDIATIHNLVEK